MTGAPMTGRTAGDRLVDGAERLAAGFLALVTAITFISVALRYVFNWSIPDGYDIGRNLLGILIFWGIAAAGFRGDHIAVDLVWGLLGRRARRAMDIFAGLVTAGFMAAFAWMLAGKVIDTQRDNVLTYDLRMPVWVFYFVAWLGIALAVPLLLGRVYRLLTGRVPTGAAATDADDRRAAIE